MATTFKDMVRLDDSVLMIVDTLNLAFRYKHAGQYDFVDDYKRTVDSLRKSYRAKYIILAADSGSSSYRKEIYPDYKQNRKDKQEQQTEEEAVEFQLFFEGFLELLDSYIELGPYPVLRFSKVEADDIAAYIVKNRKRLFPNVKKIVLISSDRDWDLMIDLDVMRFSYVTRKEVTVDNWDEHYECDPWEYISIKCLQGDSGDNVPGVPKIGPKTAKKLLDQHGTAMDIATKLPLPGKYVYIQNLNAFGAENIERNYKLMDLMTYCQDAIGEENCKTIDRVIGEYAAS